MKIPNFHNYILHAALSLARIVSEDSQPAGGATTGGVKSSKDS